MIVSSPGRHDTPNIFFSQTVRGHLFVMYIHKQGRDLMPTHSIPVNVTFFPTSLSARSDPWQYFYGILFRLTSIVHVFYRKTGRKLFVKKKKETKEVRVLDEEDPYILINDISMTEEGQQSELIDESFKFHSTITEWIQRYTARFYVVLKQRGSVTEDRDTFCRRCTNVVTDILLYYVQYDVPPFEKKQAESKNDEDSKSVACRRQTLTDSSQKPNLVLEILLVFAVLFFICITFKFISVVGPPILTFIRR